MNSKKTFQIKFLVLIVCAVVAIAGLVMFGVNVSKALLPEEDNRTVVYGAVGGGKENFMADPEVNQILNDKYNIRLINDSWSNGKLIKDKVIREDGGAYDFIFFSDERFYDYYKTPAQAGEEPRLKSTGGGVVLTTPIVIYSWVDVAEALTAEGIVRKENNTYYIIDMEKLISHILDGKTWSDVGLNKIYGKINIASTDPVTSSPGATYYGLLTSIMNKGDVDNETMVNVTPQLKQFYKISGFMNNTPSDLFDMYLRTGMGAKPMIVDYEKSLLDFAISNPQAYETVKDRICVLYPEPTIWNSHCITTLTPAGEKYLEALNDPEIQKIAWERYGFRTGITGGSYDTENMAVIGIAPAIDSVVPALKKSIYDIMIEELKTAQ